MTRGSGRRTEPCTATQARLRLGQARAFLEVAELVATDDDDLATPNVAAALAVLAGVAASDAACCAALGDRSRGQDHREAVTLLKQVEPEGRAMANDLGRLLSVKDDAEYGLLYVSSSRAGTAIKQARRLVDAAGRRVTIG